MERKTTPVRVNRIVLHIGTEKTGSSSIQHFLSKNRVALAEEGVVYPRFTGLHGGSQWGVVAAVQKKPWNSEIGTLLGIHDAAGADAYRQQLVKAIDDELLACSGCHTLIFSSEHFHSRLKKPARLRELKSWLSRWSDNVQVVVYFRRQDRVAISHYSTKLKTGNSEPPVFPPIIDDSLPYYYDYERIYANWTQVFGEKSVQAGIFSPKHLTGGDLLTDFCERVGLTETGKIRPAKINESLNEMGVQVLLELNRQWPKRARKGINPSRELLVANIAREYSGRCFPAVRDQAQAFYAHFTAGNARLANTVFPELNGQLFDDDFDDYPEVLPPQPENVSGEVRRRIRAWRAAAFAEQGVGVVRWLLPAIKSLSRVALKLHSFVVRTGYMLRRGRLMSPPKLPPVILHVGLPKTATTTLQDTLFSQHPGICYLGKYSSMSTEKGCATEEIYQALQPILWQRKKPTRKALVRTVLKEYSEANGVEKPILGSWEALLIRPPTEFQAMLREARDLFGDVRVVATLRNPLKRLPSAYLHAIRASARNGKHYTIPDGHVFISLDDWLAGSRHGMSIHDPRFDFADNLRFAAKFLGRDKVGVFLMEDMIEDREAFFASILRFMGVENVDAQLFEDKHLNPAFTTAELTFLQSIEGSKEERERWMALKGQERRARLLEIANSENNSKCAIELSEAQRELIGKRSRDLNRWLVETYDLDLERHEYPL
ncbi:hypothetical protein [Gilvimarinus sp. 1_MG-2023]|uniref:hypothetical protein n=1 Tax=Gilvimarinus sp. 1_MG-2023 TaxID=3062638 RepID=UPI0026E18CA8|nr:hypothetical protein [Gilvimarinus sp. 1_MG-2023]MDO6746285.1 hypothetical protein [Gilvimarinus sp. 1_MG-2023]